MQSRCNIAGNTMQEAIDHRVDVFITGRDGRAGAYALGNRAKPTHELLALGDGEYFCTDERLRPSL
jgi:hypothetical protein